MKSVPIKGEINKGKRVLVDDDIYPFLIGEELKFKDESSRDRDSYVYFRQKSTGKLIRLHRFVMGERNPKIQIDHINGDVLDNQRVNLRPSTKDQNNKNRTGHKDSVSKYKGVTFNKRNGKWRAQIFSDGKYFGLGNNFETEEEAAHEYDFFCLRFHCEFCRPNFPDYDYSNYIPRRKPEGWVDPQPPEEAS